MKSFQAGEVIRETVNMVHRGLNRGEGMELLVFYADMKGMQLSELQVPGQTGKR